MRLQKSKAISTSSRIEIPLQDLWLNFERFSYIARENYALTHHSAMISNNHLSETCHFGGMMGRVM
jgi:hypothetical protein